MNFWKKRQDEVISGATASNSGLSGSKSEPAIVAPPVAGAAAATVTVAARPEPSAPAKQVPVLERFGVVRSALGPGTVIQGKLSFDTPVRIDGKLSGEIFSSDALIVGEKGSVEAQVEVATLVVLGQVKGQVTARKGVYVMAGGRLEGTVATPSIMLEESAILNGRCTMGATQQAATKIITVGEDVEPAAKGARKAPRGETAREEEARREDKSEAQLH